ncbi:MAG: molybdopterin cofactor-binding domain-containing protein [Thermodesulfobacteriota bacterium]
MDKFSVLGKSVPRIDALDKVTGWANYTVDIHLPGMLLAKVLRSPLPHARILNIETSKALALPGVKAVIISADAPIVKQDPLSFRSDLLRIFATDRVRYVGDEVAAVAAVDEATAEEALDLIRVEYQELPAVFDPEEAMKPGAPQIDDQPGNVAGRYDISRGDPEEAFKRADYIFEDKVTTQIQHQCYMEPVGCLTAVDPSGKITVWLSSMDPSGMRASLAEVLGLPESKIRVIQAHVGGAFGGKISLLPLYPICSLLSLKTGRPVKIINSREEEFTATLPRIPTAIEIKSGFKKDGTILVKQTRVLADNGAYKERGVYIVAKMIVVSDNLYRIPNLKTEATVVFTNKTPVGAFRGFGTTQMCFALETHMDQAARELSLSPVELRLKNATQTGDVTSHGWKVDSCGLSQCIQEAAREAGLNDKDKRKMPGQGMGIACAPFECDVRKRDEFTGSIAFVRILEDGKAQIISGEAEYGQGWMTVAAQIAAEELGLPYEDMEVLQVDSDVTPYALGPWGLRVTVSGGNAVKLAAADAKRKIFELAAEVLEANPGDLVIENRKVQVKGSPQKAIPLASLARMTYMKRGKSPIMGEGVDEPDTEPSNRVTLYGNLARAYIFAAQAGEVIIDRETGQVKIPAIVSAHDIGRTVNPAAAEGQVEGGLATGLGYALSEEILWDGGKILNPNFLDYRVPTAADVPAIKTILVETDEPNTPFGIKAIGMPSTIMPSPLLANAIYDAIGVRLTSLPLTPDKILTAIEKTL